MKKETLEEAAENYANKKGDIPATDLENAIFKQGFLDGAKWQAQRMYSEEDLRQAYEHGMFAIIETGHGDTFEEWFKKK